ncbi:hypothetical protein ERO13_D05G268250v2 [Gossypium hirsutum]|uniref:NADH-ubiquinone oxidoreductase chain 3 n=2 Tax=Gossypium TaxID=3633 RepID=A0A5J5RHU1_GOSBA|nr:hypothetical protein ES319_D05G280900v1 [Gossypium barbadense]KAG4148147.1 hypothetical protein ERO13_D05G268250v2 [Gossypium hirsutum]TYG70221.1 hypothetical protein ES288_D05G295800v1 [Gossypium darwinii]
MNFKSKRLVRSIFHVHRSLSTFLLYKYDILWAFLIISSAIPILTFLIFGVLVPIRNGLEKLSSYESGIEQMGDAWSQFRIRYFMFALAMNFDVLKVLVFIEAFISVLLLIVSSVCA